MTDFNYNQTYYKITNKRENHRDFQYKDGLNIDIIPFNDNPNESCVPGGLYFTSLEHIIEFFNYGRWIREVKIPKDAKVIKDPDGNKWRADKIILGRKYSFEEYFEELWNPDKFNWDWSEYLAKYYSDHFDKWWNPERFDWKWSRYLAIYCSDHFDKWWNPEKFDWKWSRYLAIYCSDHFDKWWNPDKFNWDWSEYLAKYYSEHFDKWWNPEKFDWYYSYYLAKYCSDYKHIWEKDYDDRRIKND
jgi:hypothetical protein